MFSFILNKPFRVLIVESFICNRQIFFNSGIVTVGRKKKWEAWNSLLCTSLLALNT